MNAPIGRISVPVPVARMDRPPEGAELELFDSVPATEWNERFVLVDVAATRRVARQLVRALDRWTGLVTPLG